MRRAYVSITFEALQSLLVRDEMGDSVSVDSMVINDKSRTLDLYISAPDSASVNISIVSEGSSIPSIGTITSSDLDELRGALSPDEFYRVVLTESMPPF